MSYSLNAQQFDLYLDQLQSTHDVFGPILLKNKGKHAETHVVGYGKINTLSDLVLDQKSYYSPKEIFYPVRETLFYFNEGAATEPTISERPIVIFLRPCDLNGIHRLDQIFLKNGQTEDYYYKRRRKNLKFVVMECLEGFDSCFCVSMKTNKVAASDYHGALRFTMTGLELGLKDPALYMPVLDDLGVMEEASHDAFALAFIDKNRVNVQVPSLDSIKSHHFQHDLWREYTDRCIACGRCNTSCITCSCFSMQDLALSSGGEVAQRRRVWASCHVDGYTDMAGGHTFRSKNGERMRFKTLHKINDFHKRFGNHMCVGCGRCDDVCPEYISFSKCIQKLKQIVDQEVDHD